MSSVRVMGAASFFIMARLPYSKHYRRTNWALSRDHQLLLPIAQTAREPPFDAHNRVDRNLRRASRPVITFGFGGFPSDTEFGQGLPRRAQKSVLAVKD